jgi:hypothetical protein
MKLFRHKAHRGLKGGSIRSVPGNQVLLFVTVIVLVTAVLAALIWSDVVQFASSDARVIVGVTLTFTAITMVLYALFLATRTECDFSN